MTKNNKLLHVGKGVIVGLCLTLADTSAEERWYDFTSVDIIRCAYYREAGVISLADFACDDGLCQLEWGVDQIRQKDNIVSPLETREVVSRIRKYLTAIGVPVDFEISEDNFVGVILCNGGQAGGFWLYQFSVSYKGFLSNPYTRPINIPVLMDGTIPKFSFSLFRKFDE